MIIVHETFICKPGQASKLAKKFKEGMKDFKGLVHIITDLSGPFNKIVIVSQYESFVAYEQGWEEYQKDKEAMKRMEEAMTGYQDMYLTGSREFYKVW